MRNKAVVTVGFDGTPCSRNALAWAAAFAREQGDELDVVTAWNAPTELFASSAIDVANERDATSLASRGAQLAGPFAPEPPEPPEPREPREPHDVQEDPEVRIVAAEGAPADVLLDRSRGSRLLVIGLHGHRSNAPTRRVGATARACLRDSTVPVVLIGSGPPPAAPGRLVVMADEVERDPDLARWAIRSATAAALELAILDGLDGLDAVAGAPREGVWAAVTRATSPTDILVVGRSGGPVPSVLLHRARCPVLMVPTELTGLLSGPMALPRQGVSSSE
jgi:nucleotide-binding universal stress UspA family protein